MKHLKKNQSIEANEEDARSSTGMIFLLNVKLPEVRDGWRAPIAGWRPGGGRFLPKMIAFEGSKLSSLTYDVDSGDGLGGDSWTNWRTISQTIADISQMSETWIKLPHTDLMLTDNDEDRPTEAGEF